MRVVFVNPAAELGGAEWSLLDLLATLPAAWPGIDLRLITFAPGPLLDRARALGVPTEVVPLPAALAGMGAFAVGPAGKLGSAARLAARALGGARAARAFARGLRDRLDQLEPTIIHTNGIKAHLLVGLGRPRHGRVVWHVRDFLSAKPLIGPALRYAARGATAAIAISQAVAHDVNRVLGRLPTTVIYNGIDLERFAPGPADPTVLDAPTNAPAPNGPVLRVGLIATYARWKGQLVFLDAIARLPRELPARFYVIGGPIYQTAGSQFSEAELRARATQLDIADRVAFVPFQNDPVNALRALDIAIHASTRPEPFGRTIVEAMACAKPVIVARDGGAAELVQDGTDALAVPPNDPDALADRVHRLIESPDQRDALGAQARRTALARFNRDRLGPEVADLYRRLLATGRDAPFKSRNQNRDTR